MLNSLELIRKQYSKNANSYHNFDHIVKMLDELKTIELDEYDRLALTMAILYHDIVYLPGMIDNEEMSVEYFKRYENGFSEQFIEQVSRLIMATKSHKKNIDKLSDIIIDLDMMILGQSSNIYENYSKKIRKEYGDVPDDKFYPARLKFLKSLCCEDYFTVFNSDKNNKLNENMKINIATEILNIESKLVRMQQS